MSTNTMPRMPGLLLVVGLFAVVATLDAQQGTPSTVVSSPRHSSFLQYRWARASDDSTLRHYPDPANPWMSYVVGDTVVLDARGAASALASHSPVGDTLWNVTVRLTAAAASSFSRQTNAHMGDTIAVLVDDRVVSIGVINGTLGAVAPVMLGAQRAVAEALAARINQAISESHRMP